MDHASMPEASLRFGSWGPGYLLQGPRTLVGVCLLRPSDVFENHYHARHEETFVVLEGEVTLWVNCQLRYQLRSGDLHRCDPFEMHMLSNDSVEDVRLLFVKAPAVPGDKVDVPWRPGQPVPQTVTPATEES